MMAGMRIKGNAVSGMSVVDLRTFVQSGGKNKQKACRELIHRGLSVEVVEEATD